jgi:imidazoleglycerol phosphate dehydratase HisB
MTESSMTLTHLLTSLSFLALSYLCLIALNGGNVKKAAEDFADAFADGIDQAVNTNKK